MPVERAAPDGFIVVADFVVVETEVEGREEVDEGPYTEEDGNGAGKFARVGDGLEEHGGGDLVPPDMDREKTNVREEPGKTVRCPFQASFRS